MGTSRLEKNTAGDGTCKDMQHTTHHGCKHEVTCHRITRDSMTWLVTFTCAIHDEMPVDEQVTCHVMICDVLRRNDVMRRDEMMM